MSLDLSLLVEGLPCTCACGHQHTASTPRVVFDTNITHNLTSMFKAVGAYEILWHGTGRFAREVTAELEAALSQLKSNPEQYQLLNAPNGWGTYKDAVPWLEEVVRECKKHPEARLHCGV